MATNHHLSGDTNLISLSTAKEMTLRYRTEKGNVLKSGYENILLLSETFNRDAFDKLLSQSGCVGVRVYFGMNADLTIKVIAVGVNADDRDILPLTENAELISDDEGVIVEEGRPCPPFCPPPPPPETL